jgi:hypothetical protein
LAAPTASPVHRALHPDPAAAPTHLELGIPPAPPPPTASGDTGLRSGPFPSAIHHLVLGRVDPPPGEARGAAVLEGPALPFETRSPVQVMTRRIQHEGIPLAHLWRSRSAAVTIGLSPRAKPGIWLFQTSH